MGMFFIHPVFTACGFLCSILYFFTIKRLDGIRFFLFIVVMFILLSIINPLFNTNGQNVLFTYFGRPYTAEALIYGCTLAGMVVSVLCWFACYNAVMSSDKFIYMFGRLSPTLSLILSMILRLIPDMKRKAAQINTARACIGMAGEASENRFERIRNGTVTLNILTSWALEEGITSADSMTARGYGSGKRTSFAAYGFACRDVVCSIVLAFLLVLTVICAALGGMKAEFTPELKLAWFGNIWTMLGHISYTLFLLIPSVLNFKEVVQWHILRSGI